MDVSEMSRDAELLTDLTAEAPLVVDRLTGHTVSLSRKVIGHWTGRSAQTVSDYALGKLNIPVEFWRRLLEHYLDPRIVGLLIPDSVSYELHAVEAQRVLGTVDFLRDALEVEQAHHDKMSRIVDILADNRVDELDGSSIAAYEAGYHAHRLRDSQLHYAITQAYQQAAARRAAQ
jgi:hypothetical protein